MSNLRYPIPSRRPDRFRLNPASPLFGAASFLGLGEMPGSAYYCDSLRLNPGTLTGYTGAGNLPQNKWQFDPYLERWGLAGSAGSDAATMPTTFQPAPPYTWAMWLGHISGTGGGANYTGFSPYYGATITAGFGVQTYYSANQIRGWVAGRYGQVSGGNVTIPTSGCLHMGGVVYASGLGDFYASGQITNAGVNCYSTVAYTAGQALAIQGLATTYDLVVFKGLWPQLFPFLADPVLSRDLRVGGTPLLLNVRQYWPVAAKKLATSGRRRALLLAGD